ncbi:MAG: sugar ABC transporter permease [Sphaerochaetaceae bacterium]|jgi:alpha-1,4-digalacturonate transport system permease protein
MTEFRRGTRQFWTPYLFLLPNLIIFIVFVIIPAFQGLAMSFTDWSVFSTPRFVGLANFRELLSDDVFFITFRNTVVYSVLTVVLVVVVSLALALMLYRNTLPGERAFRAIFYIPSLLSMITVGIAWRFILGDEMGIVNYLLRSWGGRGVGWLTNGKLAMLSVIVVSVWTYAGYYMIIFISGLQAIPTELYEAAFVDGASPARSFRSITLPLLSPTTLVVSILATINAFKAYELILTMTKGGPGYATKFIVQQVYEVAFLEDRMGYASAMSIVLMLMIGAITLIQFRSAGKDGTS